MHSAPPSPHSPRGASPDDPGKVVSHFCCPPWVLQRALVVRNVLRDAAGTRSLCTSDKTCATHTRRSKWRHEKSSRKAQGAAGAAPFANGGQLIGVDEWRSANCTRHLTIGAGEPGDWAGNCRRLSDRRLGRRFFTGREKLGCEGGALICTDGAAVNCRRRLD